MNVLLSRRAGDSAVLASNLRVELLSVDFAAGRRGATPVQQQNTRIAQQAKELLVKQKQV